MRRTLHTAAAGLLAAAVLGAVPPAHADPPDGSAARLPDGKSWTVTLVTGDVVRVRTKADKIPTVSVTPGEGRRGTAFATSILPDGSVRVVPADVAPQIGKLLDPALFDVTGLIEQGYDDSGAKDVPLIVQRNPGARTSNALGGTLREGRQLPSIGAVAARQPKREAHRFGGALRQRAVGGIRKVWLDRRVRATTAATLQAPTRAGAPTTVRAPALDRNLTQVGAPTAWQAGYTGEGVKVAVLDSGADATHPDLAGRISESQDFAGTGSTADRFGHGTHVAATVAGTGAGSGGERKGVAPQASLLVGKVLDDEGFGTDSMVIAGMEWAAPRADVVNMSLGGWEGSDGSDPLSAALDRLTEQHGTLFVVAAGNDGLAGGIPAPAAASSALTVGAVNGSDELADFSNRGPRDGRPVAKPEIVAPGVDIIAARAEGTSMGRPIDSRYTASDGTSMATPHVAGAAALLAQRHPDWRAADLKAALTGAADPASGGDVFERGAGRLDAGAAVTAPVTAGQGIVDLGVSAFGSTGPLTGEVTWNGRAGTTLDLSVKATDRQGRDASSAVRLSASSVQVPANGTAKAGLQVDPAALPGRGLHGVEVTAEGGGTVVRTHLTFHAEPRMHTLTVKGTPPPGAETFTAYTDVINIDDVTELAESVELVDGTVTLQVPEGRYSVMGKVFAGSSVALAGDPDVVVDRDLTVTLDAARAKEVTATVTDRTTHTEMASTGYVHRIRQGYLGAAVYNWGGADEKLYVQPTGQVSTGTFEAFAGFRLTAPDEVYDLVRAFGDRFPEDVAYPVTPAERGRLARVDQRFAAFDGDTSRQMRHTRYGTHESGLFLVEVHGAVTPGTTRTDYLSPGVLWTEVGTPGMVEDMVDQLPFRTVEAGDRETYTWGRQPVRPGPYSRLRGSLSECERVQSTRARGTLRVALVPMQTRTDGFDCGFFEEDPLTHRLALYANGRRVAEHTRPAAEFSVPEGRARYRLEYDVDASKILPVSVRTSTAWTFTSQAPSDHSSPLLPLLLVDYDLALDLHNQPVPGKESVFTVAPYSGSSKVTSFNLWTSTDDGTTWTWVRARSLGGGRYAAALPASGAVSLRVAASDDRGSRIDQRIIRAYRVR